MIRSKDHVRDEDSRRFSALGFGSRCFQVFRGIVRICQADSFGKVFGTPDLSELSVRFRSSLQLLWAMHHKA